MGERDIINFSYESHTVPDVNTFIFIKKVDWNWINKVGVSVLKSDWKLTIYLINIILKLLYTHYGGMNICYVGR